MEINNQILEALGLSLVHSLWQGAALLFLVLLTLVSLRNRRAKIRYSVILFGILALPCLLTLNLNYFWPDPVVDNSAAIESVALTNSLNLPTDFQPVSINPQSSSTVLWLKEHASTIAMLWFIGMALFLMKVIGSFVWMKRLTKRALPMKGEAINTLLERAKAVLGISKKIQLKSSSWIKSPVILGIIRPTILFPIGLIEGLSVEEVEAILYHELAHLKRNDFVINIIINVLQIIFFYHPAYWWLKSQLDNEREYATDELALQYSEKKLPMIKALVKVQAFSMNQPALAFAGNSKNQVLKRINIMMNSKQQPNWLSAIFTIAILLVAFGVMSVQDTNPKSEKKNEDFPSSVNIDLNSRNDSILVNIRNGSLEFDLDPKPQDNDSSAVSKAILDLIQNKDSFKLDFENGEVSSITKSGTSLEGKELEIYRIAYSKIAGTRNDLNRQLNETLQKREQELRRALQEVESQQRNLGNKQRSEPLQHLDRLESQYQQVRKQLEQILEPGNQLDQVEVRQIQEYQNKMAVLEDQIQQVRKAAQYNNQIEQELQRRELEQVQKAAQYNEEIERALARSKMALPGGEANRDILKVILQPFSKKDATTLYILDDQVLSNSQAYEENIELLRSIQVISGGNLESFGPNAKGKNLIIKVSTKEDFSEQKIRYENQWKIQTDQATQEARKERLLRTAEEIGKSSGKMISLPGGKENKDVINLVILNIDPSYPETFIDYDGDLIEWKELKPSQIEAAKIIQVISGEALNTYKPKRKLKDKEFIIKLSSKK